MVLAVFKDQRVVASGCFPGVPQEATWRPKGLGCASTWEAAYTHATPSLVATVHEFDCTSSRIFLRSQDSTSSLRLWKMWIYATVWGSVARFFGILLWKRSIGAKRAICTHFGGKKVGEVLAICAVFCPTGYGGSRAQWHEKELPVP